jgi:hypothetical protein
MFTSLAIGAGFSSLVTAGAKSGQSSNNVLWLIGLAVVIAAGFLVSWQASRWRARARADGEGPRGQ